MLGCQLAELIDGLLWLLKAQIGCIGRDGVATKILDAHLATVCPVMEVIDRACGCDTDLGVQIEDAAARPNVLHRERRRVMVLRLGRILVVQVLQVQVELPWLTLVRESGEVWELRYWARLGHAGSHRRRSALLLLLRVVRLDKIVSCCEEVCRLIPLRILCTVSIDWNLICLACAADATIKMRLRLLHLILLL